MRDDINHWVDKTFTPLQANDGEIAVWLNSLEAREDVEMVGQVTILAAPMGTFVLVCLVPAATDERKG